MISKSSLVKIAFNSVLGVMLIAIWLHFVDLDQLWQSIKGVNLTLLVPVAAFMVLSIVVRSYRLQLFLKPIKQIPLRQLFFLNGAALLFNVLIPIRAGEIAKGLFLNTKFNLPFTKSITWIFLDRFLDFLFVLVAGAALLLAVSTTFNITFITIIIVIFFIGIFLTYLMVFKPQLAKLLFNLLKPLLGVEIVKTKLEKLFNSFLESFIILRRSPKDLGLFFVLTGLAYISDTFVWYLAFLSLDSKQDFLRMFLAQLMSALTYLVPAAPGYVGSAEASGILVFSGILGINNNLASSMTVLVHIITLLVAIILGVISLDFLKINPKLVFGRLGKLGK